MFHLTSSSRPYHKEGRGRGKNKRINAKTAFLRKMLERRTAKQLLLGRQLMEELV